MREGMVDGMVHGMAVFCLSPCFNHHGQVHGLVQETKKDSNDHKAKLV